MIHLRFAIFSLQDFSGSAGEYNPVYHNLKPPIRARYIRFLPLAWYGNIAMRVELYGCQGTIMFLLLFRKSATKCLKLNNIMVFRSVQSVLC